MGRQTYKHIRAINSYRESRIYVKEVCVCVCVCALRFKEMTEEEGKEVLTSS